jgi:hypothetical protein
MNLVGFYIRIPTCASLVRLEICLQRHAAGSSLFSQFENLPPQQLNCFPSSPFLKLLFATMAVTTEPKTTDTPVETVENKAVEEPKTVDAKESTESPPAESTNEKVDAKTTSLPKDESAVETSSKTSTMASSSQAPTPFGGAKSSTVTPKASPAPSSSFGSNYPPLSSQAPTPFNQKKYNVLVRVGMSPADAKKRAAAPSVGSSYPLPPLSNQAPTPFGGAKSSAVPAKASPAATSSSGSSYPPLSSQAPTPFGGVQSSHLVFGGLQSSTAATKAPAAAPTVGSGYSPLSSQAPTFQNSQQSGVTLLGSLLDGEHYGTANITVHTSDLSNEVLDTVLAALLTEKENRSGIAANQVTSECTGAAPANPPSNGTQG